MDWNKSFGLKLLASLVLWEEEDIKKSLSHIHDYNLAIRKKKNGGIRKTYAPHKEMKRLQRALLRKFFYKIPLLDHREIFGFVPKRSYKDNALAHCQPNGQFFFEFDLENAFPTVKKKDLRNMLEEILKDEIDYIQNSIPGNQFLTPETSGLFPWKKVRWFRKMISKKDKRISLVLDEFLDILLEVITYKGNMAQGIPTSPWLLNLFLGYSGLIRKLKNFLKDQEIFVNGKISMSIYADDFTISSDKPISWHQRKQVVDIVEKNSIFKINPKKTRYLTLTKISPMVTGLRIVKMPHPETEECLKASKELAQGLGMKGSKLEETIAKRKKELAKHTHLEPRIPKKQIRKIRGLIHLAGGNEKSYEEMKNIIDGHLANLHHIYGGDLPNQLKKPLKKYTTYKKN